MRAGGVRERAQSAWGRFDVSLASSLTKVSPEGRLAIRGYDIRGLAESNHYEQVAELLWTGEIPARPRWSEGPEEAALRVARALSPGSPPVERPTQNRIPP